MVAWSALHSLTAELHSGMLTLATLCIVAVAVAQLVVGYRDRFPKRLVNLAIRTRGYFEATGYVAAVGGVVGLVLSGYTGMNAWPPDVLLESALIRNKITITIFVTVLWMMIVFIRVRFGRGLWTCPLMATLYTGLAVFAFGLIALTGSMGAHTTVGESIADPVWALLGIDVTKDLFMFPMWLGGAIALAAIGLLVTSLIVARRHKLYSVELTPEACSKVSGFLKWDEPTTDLKK